jgi:hypothetical protein
VLVSEYQRCEDSERLAMAPIRQTNGQCRFNNNAVKSLAASTTDTEDTGEDEGSDCQTHHRNTNFSTIRQSLSMTQKRALKKEMKAEKSIIKASKNQQKHTVSVRREDIESVARAIHGDDFGAISNDGHPLGTDKTIEQVVKRNLGFVSAIQGHRFALLRSLAKERDPASKNRLSQRSENDEAELLDVREHMEDLVVAVLEKLGVHSASPTLAFNAPATNSFGTLGSGKRTKAAIVQKLSAAIAEDIENHENEQRQTYQRAAGFWRYANHEILVRLTEHAKKVNWATGEKITRKGSDYGQDGAGDR